MQRSNVLAGLEQFPEQQQQQQQQALSSRNAWACAFWTLQVQSPFTVLSKSSGISLICVGVRQNLAQQSYFVQDLSLELHYPLQQLHTQTDCRELLHCIYRVLCAESVIVFP